MLTWWFADGRIIDAILLLVLAEAVVLAWRFGRPGRWAASLAAGFMLMLALRLALGSASPVWLALCLLLSLAAHLVDLWIRLRPRSAAWRVTSARGGSGTAASPASTAP
ncbi:hypothetical protein [Lichenicola sp.]|uniref:hypothetical protein n=1 Tax=Lichenicola sp. TaxID=2804529 RepID=UPI003AFFE04D